MFTLTIEDGNGQTADRFSFDHGAYVIGRHEECDIVLPSTSVSRQHARIFIDNGRCYVEDLGSSNGVVVDGQRVIKQRDLGTASQIKVGDFYLYLEYKRPDRAAQANVLQTLFISDDSDHCKLVRINDSFAGEEFSLSEVENTIGRTDDNFILLSDASISRHHARIFREGERYTMMDLGSSNGSRLNTVPVTIPQVLSPGDRVHFGNVEFVFAPGHIEINPAEYAGAPGGGGIVLVVGLVVLILLGVVIGGLIALGFISLQEPEIAREPPAAHETVEGRILGALADGKAKMERRDWSGASAAFDDVIALSPKHTDALKLKKQTELEKRAQDTFERGETRVEEGQHREAMSIFAEVPANTVAHTRAKEQLQHVRKAVAYDLRNEAMNLLKGSKPDKKNVLAAYDKLREALELNPSDAESQKLLTDLRATAKKRKISLPD